jgi:hypothetical protein
VTCARGPSSEANLARGGVQPSSGADLARGGVQPSSGVDLAQGGVQPSSKADLARGGVQVGRGSHQGCDCLVCVFFRLVISSRFAFFTR